MKAKSKYLGLNWLVQCRLAGCVGFETFAAFDTDIGAIDFAKTCKANNPENAYRVLEHRNNEPKCIYRSDALAAV